MARLLRLPVIERVETELGWEFMQVYGLTETSPLLTLNRRRAEWDTLTPTERAWHLGRAGAPAIGVRVRIDEAGEVLARGNVVLRGYWDQQEATDEVVADGWFRTGDGGRLDSQGYLTISDRKKDVIVSGGENVSSIEVEDCLCQHALSPRPPSSACPTRSGARPSRRSSSCDRVPTPPRPN